MPEYDFRCEKCKKKFSLTLTISEHDARKAKCPKCKSKRVKQLPSSFFAVTSSKS